MSKPTNPCHVVTGKCRLSYEHLITPAAIDDNSPAKYSACIVVPKSDTTTLAKITGAIELAIQEGIQSKWRGKRPAKLKLPLRDGDVERPDDPVFADAYFLNANSTRRPKLVDRDRNEILDAEEIYSGCYCRFAIDFYPFSTSGNNGVAVGLSSVQKWSDGPRLTGGADPETDFNDGYDDGESYDDL